jgi:hypothetical protein
VGLQIFATHVIGFPVRFFIGLIKADTMIKEKFKFSSYSI